MRKKRKMKYAILGVLGFAIVGMSIGFASMTEQLNISATAAVNPYWKIEYIMDGNNTFLTRGVTVLSQPQISNTSISGLNFEFDATKGEVVYYFKVKNKGSLKAKIGTLDIGTPSCSSTSQGEANLVCGEVHMSLEHDSTCGQNIGSYAGGGDESLPEATINNDNKVKVDDIIEAGQTDCRKLIIRYDGPIPSAKVTISGISVNEIYEMATA